MKTNSMFEDPLISKFTNMMMKGGNKVLARSLMTQVNSTSLLSSLSSNFVLGSFRLAQNGFIYLPLKLTSLYVCMYVLG